MITPLSDSTLAENRLLTYILRQLKLCNVHLFQEYIRTLHVAFQEGKHPNMTPTSLLSEVEDKIRVLKHASEWTLDEPVATPAMSLVTTSSTTSSLEELLKQQTALIAKLLQAQKGGHGQNTYNDCKHKAPANLNDIRRYNGKIFRWCTKCNNGQGQWASAHDTRTHVDSFKNDRNKNNGGRNTNRHTGGHRPSAYTSTQPHDDNSSQSDTPPHGTDLNNKQAKTANTSRLHLADSLENGWRFDVSDQFDNP